MVDTSSAGNNVIKEPRPDPAARTFVSRAGIKLDHALDAFDFEVADLVAADFGCNVGGFTDCLLQRLAHKVFAIDTGYGTLAYTLRRDDRVIVMERTNALHVDPPDDVTIDLVVIDLAWTKQRHAIPAALKWVSGNGHILTLVKPHYELTEDEKETNLIDGRLDPEFAHAVLERVNANMPSLGAKVVNWVQSPLTGRKSSKGGGGRKARSPGKVGPGNIEFMVLCQPLSPT